MKNLVNRFKEDSYKVGLFFILLFLVGFSIYALRPHIAGDSFYYINSMQVLSTGIQPPHFIPMMIVSTYLGLRLIMFFDFFIKNINISWLVLDSILYVTMGLFFYSLLKRIVQDAQTAFLGTLFLVTNYAAVTFGLGYLMDMGGWTAYVASLYFSYRYLESEKQEENKWLYVSALMVGIGGLYKEYAFVAYVVIFGLVIFKNWKNWLQIFWKVFVTGCISFVPFFLLNVYGYFVFHYTYLNWFLYQKIYSHQNKIVEFIKSFGSIYTFGWFLFLGGLWILIKRSKEIIREKQIDKNVVFIWLVALSSFAVIVWPVVTRVLFIAMPAVVIVTSLFIQSIDRRKRLFVVVPILLIYIVCCYLMDAYILNFVNLGI